MKSLVFGAYGNHIQDYHIQDNIDIFSFSSKRELKEFRFPKLRLFYYKGITDIKVIENNTFFIAISGEWIDSTISFNDYDSIHVIFEKFMNSSGNLFTICLYDKIGDKLFLSNDRFGLFPLFYRIYNNTLIFSNEYQPLIRFANSVALFDKKQISLFFQYGFTTEGNTFFKDIKKLQRNEYLIGNRKIHVIKQKYGQSFTDDYDQWVEKLYNALLKSVTRLSTQYTNVSIAITGGLDSRIVLGLMSDDCRNKSKFITFPSEPLDETNDKDVLIAKKISKAFSLDHSVVQHNEKTSLLTIDYFDEIRKLDSIIITGLLGGEIMTFALFEDVIPKETRSIIEGTHWSNKFLFKNYILKKELSKHDLKWFYFEKLSSSFFTSIYGGTEGSWVHPWMNFLRFFSPFMDVTFLEILFSAPIEFIEKDKDNLIVDLYDRYFKELKMIPTNSNKKGLIENNFLIEQEGIEPKKQKKMKTDNLFEQTQKMKGYILIPYRFKRKSYLSKKENQQRIIDFCFWYEYISRFK